MDRSSETLLTTSLRQQTHDKTKCHLKLKEQYTRFIGIKILFIVVFLILIAALPGSADIPAPDVYANILNKFAPAHFAPSPTETIDAGAIMLNSRLPRILIGIAAGLGLAVAGSTMQGIRRNSLASPYTLGIASAAGFGAALGILLNVGIAGGRYYSVGELSAGQVCEIATAEQELLTELHSIRS